MEKMYMLLQHSINNNDKVIRKICKKQGCKYFPSIGYWEGLVLIKSKNFNEIKNKQKIISGYPNIELHQEFFLDEILVNKLKKKSIIERISLIFNADEKEVINYCEDNKLTLIKATMGPLKYVIFCDDFEKYKDWGSLRHTDLILKEKCKLGDLI